MTTRRSARAFTFAMAIFGCLVLATPASAVNLTLNWVDNSLNETGFNIERCLGLNCTSFAIIASVGVNVRTYVDATPSEGSTFCYRVAATNNAGISGYTNTACRAVPATTPAAPTGLTISKLKDGMHRVSLEMPRGSRTTSITPWQFRAVLVALGVAWAD